MYCILSGLYDWGHCSLPVYFLSFGQFVIIFFSLFITFLLSILSTVCTILLMKNSELFSNSMKGLIKCLWNNNWVRGKMFLIRMLLCRLIFFCCEYSSQPIKSIIQTHPRVQTGTFLSMASTELQDLIYYTCEIEWMTSNGTKRKKTTNEWQ